MLDACFIGVPPQRLSRFVRRASDNPFAALNCPDLLRHFPGAGSATATAWDMAVFGQMFLNHGRYGDARIVSPASVVAMTRDQIPGVAAVYGAERFPQAGWGYGFDIKVNKRETNRSGLESPRTFQHGGAGGVSLLVDPANELVIAYCSVETSGAVGEVHQWCLDHLTDAVIGAIAD
jgi:CubicO group peptidase (beta-lactamase class C family)